MNKPSLVINNGQYMTDGNMGNYYYLFETGEYSYECWLDFLDSSGFNGSLMVYKKDDLILREQVLLDSGKKTNVLKQKDYIKNSSIKQSISEIMKTFEVIKTSSNISQSTWDTNRSDFQSILELDVYNYFNLNKKYNSDLQRKHYENMDDFNKKLQIVKSEKQFLLEKFYALKGSDHRDIGDFNSRGVNILTNNSGFEINYDLDKGGFYIPLNWVSNLGCTEFAPKVISDIEFTTLPVNRKWNKYKDAYKQLFFVRVSEDNALEIENNRESIEIIFLFQIKGIEERKKESKSLSKCKPIKVITTKGLRVLLFNKSNSKIYFDKVYN